MEIKDEVYKNGKLIVITGFSNLISLAKDYQIENNLKFGTCFNKNENHTFMIALVSNTFGNLSLVYNLTEEYNSDEIVLKDILKWFAANAGYNIKEIDMSLYKSNKSLSSWWEDYKNQNKPKSKIC